MTTFKELKKRIESVFSPEYFDVYMFFSLPSERFLFAVKRIGEDSQIVLDPWYEINGSTGKIKGYPPFEHKEEFNEAMKSKNLINMYKEASAERENLAHGETLMSSLEERPFLSHYGVLGMKWGVRRYQPYSLIPRKSGKNGKEIGSAKSSTSNTQGPKKHINKVGLRISSGKKSRKQKSIEAKQQVEQEAKTARQRAEQKQRAIKSGSATEVFNNRSTMTNRELQDAISRINMERTIRDLYAIENHTPTKLEKFNRVMDKVDQARGGVEKGISAYNTLAKIHNTVSDNEWRTIGGDSKKLKNTQKALEAATKARNENLAKLGVLQKQMGANERAWQQKVADLDASHNKQMESKENSWKQKMSAKESQHNKEMAAKDAEYAKNETERNSKWDKKIEDLRSSNDSLKDSNRDLSIQLHDLERDNESLRDAVKNYENIINDYEERRKVSAYNY